MARRKKSAEGAEIPYEDGMYLPVKRGGMDFGYFKKIPNVAGSGSWSRLDEEEVP